MTLMGKHYRDFGPTLAAEKLLERHSHKVSTETLRQWIIVAGLWQPKTRKRVTIHPSRPRRPCFGELVQIDGSPHHWFEGRGPYCTLIVLIDDADGELLALHFSPTETTRAYMEALSAYLQQQGRPVALYSDKHSIFRVKELRLQGISGIETASAFLPSFMADYNPRFAVTPRSPANAHREVLYNRKALALIFSLHYTRRLSKNLSCQFKNPNTSHLSIIPGNDVVISLPLMLRIAHKKGVF